MNSELMQKEKDAIERLKAFEPIGDSYYLCYSGGKDSDVIRILALNSAYQRIASGKELYYEKDSNIVCPRI